MATFTGSNSAEIIPDLILGPVQGIGNDFVDALGGDDVAIGWSGDDVIRGGAGADAIIGGLLNAAGIITNSGIDAADYTTSIDGVTIDLSVTVNTTLPMLGINIQMTGASLGFGGDAQGDYLAGIVNLIGSNTGRDILSGNAGANTFNGQGGNDVLSGNDGNDILLGGAGDDILIGGAAADSLQGGAGLADTADYSASATFVTVNLNTGTATGGDAQGDTLTGIENLIGSAGDDALIGSAGDNVLDGGIGADTLDGSDGNDTASYASSAARVIVNLALGAGLEGSAQGDILSNIENLTGSAFADMLTGDGGNNALNGGDGDDLLEGGAGADTVNGGNGSDTASYAGSAAAVAVNLVTGIASGGDATGDAFASIENLVGSLFDDALTGDAGANRLDGNGGVDIMAGLAGADTYVVDNLGDIVDESGGASELDRIFSSVSVNLSDTSRVVGLVEAVQLLGTGNLEAIGNAARNYLTGNQGDNVIDGGAGADSMWGRGGNDTYVVDNIGDLVDESIYGGTGIDTVVSSIGFNLGDTSQARGALENLALIGSANANAIGNSLVNVLVGNDGANIVAGGLGNDQLTGGGANDVFFFNTAPGVGNVDIITDMNESGDDSIWLDDAVFTALTAGPLAAAAFVISSLGAVDADDRIVYDSTNGELSYDADGNGGAAGILFAILDSGLDLTAVDFRVV